MLAGRNRLPWHIDPPPLGWLDLHSPTLTLTSPKLTQTTLVMCTGVSALHRDGKALCQSQAARIVSPGDTSDRHWHQWSLTSRQNVSRQAAGE